MLIETFGKLIARKFVKLLVSTESQIFSGVFTSSLVISFLCIRAKEKTDEEKEKPQFYFCLFRQFGFIAVLYYKAQRNKHK